MIRIRFIPYRTWRIKSLGAYHDDYERAWIAYWTMPLFIIKIKKPDRKKPKPHCGGG